jgi:hypothetical protein
MQLPSSMLTLPGETAGRCPEQCRSLYSIEPLPPNNYTLWPFARWIKLVLPCLFVALSQGLSAATYFVAKTGSNSNPGTLASPFLTVQKGVNTAQAGDTVLVGAGTYTENVSSARSGTVGSRITIDGQGVATVWSFTVTHRYLTFQNFTIAGKASGNWFWMGKGGHNMIVSNNVFDGEWNPNMYTLMKWDNPYPYELPWGTNCASGCLIISNTFKRAINEAGGMVMYGETNVVYGNTFRDYDSCDWLYLWGKSNRIVANLFTNLFVLNGKGHPDLVQQFGQNGHGGDGILVESNLFIHAPGDVQICMFEGQDCPWFTNFTFRNNLFVRIGSKGTMVLPNVNWYNNTFIECATNVAAAPYVLIVGSQTNGTTYTNFAASTGNGVHVLNNIFYNCGDGANSHQLYYIYAFCQDVQADYNFICNTNYTSVPTDPLHRAVGDPGGWDPYGWWEPHGINGGNPFFANESKLDFRPQGFSPLIAAALPLNQRFTTDMRGTTRGAKWDIGALQFRAGPSSPINLRLVSP